MSESSETPTLLEAARIEREQAEGAKLREEREKLRAERREIELRLGKPWYRKEAFFKAVVGGLLALPVMWFFFDQIIRPVYTVENKKLWVEVEEARLEVDAKEKDLQKARVELEAAWAEARKAEEEITRREDHLKSQQARLVADYDRLLAEEKSAAADLADEIARLKANLTVTRGMPGGLLTIQDQRLQGQRVSFVPSPLEGRPMEAKALVLHTTVSDSLASTVSWLQKQESFSSEHVLIGRDGAIVQMVPFDRTGAHAGSARLPNGDSYNRSSIGISLVNAGQLQRTEKTYRAWFGREIDPAEVLEVSDSTGSFPTYWHKPTPVQLRTLEAIIALLVDTYPIDTLVGHDAISRGRKTDPGPVIPVKELGERFLGSS